MPPAVKRLGAFSFMPYSCAPDDTEKMESCIERMMQQGHDKSSAIAICCSTIGKGKAMKSKVTYKPTKRNAEQDAKRERLRKDMAHKAELGRLAQSALEELEGEEKKEESPIAEEKEVKCDDEMGGYAMPMKAYGGATSLKAAMEAMRAGEMLEEMTSKFDMYRAVEENILTDETITDKASAIFEAADELKKMMGAKKELPVETKAWATFAEGGKFCVYKVDSDGNKTGDSIECYASRADGNAKVEELYGKSLKAGARHSKPDNEMIQSVHDVSVKLGAECGMKMLKQTDGAYRWFGWVSNKFRDRDTAKHPQGEIITEAAHKEFITYLDAHPDKAPEWWTWHTPVRKSKADWWDYADGYLLMSGPASEEEAKGYIDDTPIAMSHGFHVLKRDSAKGLIQSYRSFEVSDLPPDVAANPYTSFEMVRKELSMLTKEKREYLVKRLGEERVAAIEKDTEAMSKELEAAGVEWKEANATPTPVAVATTPTDPAEAIETLKELFNVKELNDTLTALQASNKALADKLDAQAKELAELKKSSDEKVAETIAPKVKPLRWGFQASEAKETLVKEDDPIAKQAPDNWLQQVFAPKVN